MVMGVLRSVMSLGLLSGGRSYEIKGKTNSAARFTVRNELFSIGKKLTLLENGKDLYTVSRFSSLRAILIWYR